MNVKKESYSKAAVVTTKIGRLTCACVKVLIIKLNTDKQPAEAPTLETNDHRDYIFYVIILISYCSYVVSDFK